MRLLAFSLLLASSCFHGVLAHPYTPEMDLRNCEAFRRINEAGKSFRGPEFLSFTRAAMAKKGYSKKLILHKEWHDQQAVDFYCPDVW